LFEINRGNISNQKELISDELGVSFIAQNNCDNGFVDKVKPENNRKFKGNSLVIGRQTAVVYYQENDFITTDGVLVLIAKNNFIKNRKVGLIIASILTKNMFPFAYNNTVSAEKLNRITIQLPTKDSEIDFEFMESFIAELEAERISKLEAYLVATGLKDYTLTKVEKQTLEDFENGKVEFGEFSYQKIFNKIVQGRRLKKDDQIAGDIPFIMAGITNTGVVNYISNPVASFPKNSITVDIFGNTFYRDYDYGAGDDTGVYWNTEQKYSKANMLFFATSIEKSIVGKFDFGNKLRSSQSLDFTMQLPTKNNQPEYEIMDTLISAIQKLVIKDVVLYTDQRKHFHGYPPLDTNPSLNVI
jgi:hypothetical protein